MKMKFFYIDDQGLERSWFVDSEAELESIPAYAAVKDSVQRDTAFDEQQLVQAELDALNRQINQKRQDPAVLQAELTRLETIEASLELPSFIGFRASNVGSASNGQRLASGETEKLNFTGQFTGSGEEVFEDNTFVVGTSGKYEISSNNYIRFQGETSFLTMSIYVNGDAVEQAQYEVDIEEGDSTIQLHLYISRIIPLVAGDLVDIRVFQASGEKATVLTSIDGANRASFQGKFLGT